MFNRAILKATYLDEFRLVYHSFEDKPAVFYRSGAKEWYKEGVLHRDDDLPALIYKDKTKIWYQDGEVSRLLGPAIIWYGDNTLKTYCVKGKILNPSSKLIQYPSIEEEKMGYFGKSLFVMRDKTPYIFSEYVMKFDIKFYNKYRMILV